MVLTPLCERTLYGDTEYYEGECEDVNESIGEAFHEGAAVMIGTCGRHCVIVPICGPASRFVSILSVCYAFERSREGWFGS